ncbi:uncharacterized protein LOC111617725 [Centruroides sculpturatus]|uniref:uncharacterized protein LOC111617724 n=1 Tax=Centruroides sculpturatus TaxID=218467 RepID=UPI000C6E76EF|nr:uncharacterized protein LOC111617724 [Centruroides sculpturatus]XP_023214781.1 uncharacterized protein LOC111617725 [Centruroides sculpturatus]
MKLCILLVLGVIVCNLCAINGFRMKRQIDDFCGLPVKLRSTIWNCIESQLSFKDRQTYSGIALCFNEANFVDVMNRMCGKTEDEIDAMAALHEDCLEELDMDDESNEIDADEEEVANCVMNNM